MSHDTFSPYYLPNTKVEYFEFEDYLYFAAVQCREEDHAYLPTSEVEKAAEVYNHDAGNGYFALWTYDLDSVEINHQAHRLFERPLLDVVPDLINNDLDTGK